MGWACDKVGGGGFLPGLNARPPDQMMLGARSVAPLPPRAWSGLCRALL